MLSRGSETNCHHIERDEHSNDQAALSTSHPVFGSQTLDLDDPETSGRPSSVQGV